MLDQLFEDVLEVLSKRAVGSVELADTSAHDASKLVCSTAYLGMKRS